MVHRKLASVELFGFCFLKESLIAIDVCVATNQETDSSPLKQNDLMGNQAAARHSDLMAAMLGLAYIAM